MEIALSLEANLQPPPQTFHARPPGEEVDVFEHEDVYYSHSDIGVYIDLLSKYLEHSNSLEDRLRDKLEKVRLCNTKKFIYTCEREGSRHHVKVIFNHCNERKLCPNCGKRYALKRAIELYEFLKVNLAVPLKQQGIKLYLTHIVLTFPHDSANLEAIEQNMSRILKRVFLGKNKETAILYRIHRYSSKNPFNKHLHVHIIAPNVAIIKKHETYRFIRLTPHFNIDKLKRRLVEAIYLEAGILLSQVPDVYCYFHPFYRKDEILHTLSYVFRTPAIDFFKFFTSIAGNRLVAVYLDNIRYDTLFSRVLGVEPRPSWLGYLANSKRYRLPIPLKIRLSDLRRSLKEASLRCKVCGSRLVKFEGFEPTVEDLFFHNPDALLEELRRREALRRSPGY